MASTSNDSLGVGGQTRFKVCPICGYADATGIPTGHRTMRGYPCPFKEGTEKEYNLSHDFKTDVARITFADEAATDLNTMRSVLYAMLEGLSREMGIERTDIKGCLFRTYEDGLLLYSVILYDAVAGGAGHVRRMVTEDGAAFQRVLRKAYSVVSECDCGSSCYKCLRNYYNQKIHDDLDRHKAADFLRKWLGEMQTSAPDDQGAEQKEFAEVKVKFSEGYGCSDYESWEEFEPMIPENARASFADMDMLHVPLPTASYCTLTVPGTAVETEVLFKWEDRKILVFAGDSPKLRIRGWTSLHTDDIKPEEFAELFNRRIN